MKKFLLLAGVACLFAANAEAGVNINQYVSGKVSYDWNRNKIKNVVNGVSHRARLRDENYASHIAYGAQAGFIRGELELNNTMPMREKSSNGETSLKTKVYKYSVMANAYFDFLNCTSWTPYVGLGMGTSWLKAKTFAYNNGAKSKSFDKSVYNFAWQVMAGLTYKINSHWTVDAGYRYADLGRIRKHDVFGADSQTVKLKVRDHSALLGVRYTF
ncbi:MAG: porin family protein [Alphaproteobacteria bacterium]|nr:porin family protein [Alphaproteobacteria bacterium]